MPAFRVFNIPRIICFTQNTYAGYAELDPGLDIILEVDLRTKNAFITLQ